MANTNLVKAFNRAVEEVDETPAASQNGMSVESLTLFMTTTRVNQLEEQMRKELKDLRKRQDKVRRLHDVLKAINKTVNEKDGINWENDKELKALLDEARKLGADIPEGKYKFNSSERMRLVENIRLTIDDFNLQNDLQMQTITRLQNERYESYQMARSILKPLHEDKINKSRKIAG